VSKGLILLDMPDEYQDEFVEKGTIDGKPIDKYNTMNRRELKVEINKLKNERDKIITEETKGLEVERDGLIAENRRLKTFEPIEDKTPEWCLGEVEKIKTLVLNLCNQVRSLSFDERMTDDFRTQALIEAQMSLSIKTLEDFDREWNRQFTIVEM